MVAFVIESWIWYGVVTFIVVARLLGRTAHLHGIRKWQLDDYLMILAWAFYTTDIVTINIVAHENTNLLPPGYMNSHVLTPHEIESRRFGSKLVLVVEQSQCCTTWLAKACLLTMYYRITYASFATQHLLVKILIGYVAATFVVMEILYFGVWCRPFHDYWAVPTPSIQCSAAIDHLITNAVFNISSDVAMLCISLPMFITSHLPTQKKIILCAVFSLGIFVIVCSVLNKYYSFSHPFGSEWTYWYVRECSTSLLVANLPFTWALVKKVFGIHEKTKPDSCIAGGLSTETSEMLGRKRRFPLFGIIKGMRPDGKDSADFSLGSAPNVNGMERMGSVVKQPASTVAGRSGSVVNSDDPWDADFITVADIAQLPQAAPTSSFGAKY